MSGSVNTIVRENAFYKRLALLSSLHDILREQHYKIERSREEGQPPLRDRRFSTEHEFQDLADERHLRKFLDRLAEICASEHDGSTVTAITIYRPGPKESPRYKVASNGRSDDARAVKSHVKYVLSAFQNQNEASNISQRKAVLEDYRTVSEKILLFNRQRLKVYLKTISTCLEQLETTGKNLDETG